MLETEEGRTAEEKQTKPPAFRGFLASLQGLSSAPLPQLKRAYTAVKLPRSSFHRSLSRVARPPASFPSPAEIREHGRLAREDDDDDRRVWQVEWQGVNMYVKEGKDIDRGEAQMTELARKKTGLPIPKVYRVELHGDSTYSYLEALPGRDLASAMIRLSPPQIQALQKELGQAVKRLHRVKAPVGSRVGAPGSRTLFAMFPEREITPFLQTPAEFHAWLRQLYLSHYPTRAEEYDREIGSHFDDSAPLVLVHGDLHPLNILVDGGKLSGIIDFGRAGWYPEWVERWTPELILCLYSLDAMFRLLEAMDLATEEGKEWMWAYKAMQGWRGKIED
ncbi:hypothetical protein JCM10213_004429 [Rhodosporidiobolus nylandii]